MLSNDDDDDRDEPSDRIPLRTMDAAEAADFVRAIIEELGRKREEEEGDCRPQAGQPPGYPGRRHLGMSALDTLRSCASASKMFYALCLLVMFLVYELFSFALDQVRKSTDEDQGNDTSRSNIAKLIAESMLNGTLSLLNGHDG